MKNAKSKLTTYKGIEGYFIINWGEKFFGSKETRENSGMRKHIINLTDEEWAENAPSEMIESDSVDSGYGFMMKDTPENWRKVRRYKYDAIEMVN